MAAKTKKGKAVKIVCICLAGALAVGAGAIALFRASEDARAASTSVLTYKAAEVAAGNVASSVSGSGALTPVQSRTVTSAGAGSVEKVYYKVGDVVPAGTAILKIANDTAQATLEELEDSLESVENSLATADQTASSKKIPSPAKGRVKLMAAEAGDLVEDVLEETGYLCVISTDGNMRVTFTPAAQVKKYDTVTVEMDGQTEEGRVIELDGDTATVQIEDNTYAVGERAKVLDSEGKTLGEGTLALGEYLKVTADTGVIQKVNKAENSTVYQNTTLFTLADYPTSSNYTALKEQKADLEEQIADAKQQLEPSFDVDMKVTDLPVKEGDTLAEGDAVLTAAGLDGFQMTVAVDELDISDVQLGQEAAVTVEAVDKTFTGTVTYISEEGVQNGNVTTYDVVVTVNEAEGVLSGMSASAEITTTASKEGLIVPVEAVQTRRGESFVYLAPEGTAAGDELDASIDLDALEQASVEQGMSDGLYQQVTGELSQGDVILVPTRTTTGDGTSSEEQQAMTMPGGMTPPDGLGQFGGGQFGGGQRQNRQNGGGNRKSGA